MDYKFTDLPKTKNYLGFASGVFCAYPNYINSNILSNNVTCEEKDFFNAAYPGQPVPMRFDPRCRPWYKKQFYHKDMSIFTNIYKFANDKLGITNCVPLTDGWTFYGSYCIDLLPTGDDSDFLTNYYAQAAEGQADYILFTEDEEFSEKQYMKSKIKDYL